MDDGRTISELVEALQQQRAANGSAEARDDAPPAFPDIRAWRAADRFQGEPRPRRWLIDRVFPLGRVSLLAAAGGVGKSFLMLQLARAVAGRGNREALLSGEYYFGGSLECGGPAVLVTAEDDGAEVHARLRALGDIPNDLYVLPLPDAGGAVPLFAPDRGSRAPVATPAWQALCDQFRQIEGLRLVALDPLQPLCALDLNMPENAQFVCSALAALAAEAGAAVVVAHHFRKTEVADAASAREAIRGTGGLVDGVRSVVALWPADDKKARETLRVLGESAADVRNRVVMGATVKSNGQASWGVTTFVRDSDTGLLVDVSQTLAQRGPSPERLKAMLVAAIATAAAKGKPYTRTGLNGIYAQRATLPEPLRTFQRARLEAMTAELLEAGRVVQAAVKAGGTSRKWLDTPAGPVAAGTAVLAKGHLARDDGEAPEDFIKSPREPQP